MSKAFLTRAAIRNYKSIAACDVSLRPLTFLIGPNGAGKSNFLDALRFVADGLRTSLEHAFRERGGIGEVRRRSGGHPTHFGVRLELALPDGSAAIYGFQIGAKPNGAYEVRREECVVQPAEALAAPVWFSVAAGEVTGDVPGPAAAPDRLYLVAASGLPEFRPVYDALSRMGFYNLNPESIRDIQPPGAGDLLARDGRNIAAVLERMASECPERKVRIEEYLSRVVPGLRGVDPVVIGPRETLQFRQDVPGVDGPWRFLAANTSDGVLRALGGFVAAFQAGPAPLVGIEDAESGLHPAAAEILFEALSEATAIRQALVTSHTTVFLDSAAVEQESILAVVSDGACTYVGPVEAVGKDALMKRLTIPGQLLLVDGLRPEKAQPEIARQLFLGEDPGLD